MCTVTVVWRGMQAFFGVFVDEGQEKGTSYISDLLTILSTMSPLCAVERRGSSVGANPTRQLLLQPVAIGAVVKATTLPEPSMQRVAWATRRVGRPSRG